jgi:hypothetical protein
MWKKRVAFHPDFCHCLYPVLFRAPYHLDPADPLYDLDRDRDRALVPVPVPYHALYLDHDYFVKSCRERMMKTGERRRFCLKMLLMLMSSKGAMSPKTALF